MVDFKAIEEKWRTEWERQEAFEANADPGRKKFFVTFPYPYMNGYLHLGHFYSIMRTEAFARYKRLKGFNVLFPQGWHCTGSPIESAAKRIREKEPGQWKTMKLSGFSEQETGQFGNPEHWTEFFPKTAKQDLIDLGMSIDFRRSFITTDLNPQYNRFIEWQFRKLKEKGYVVKGNHPVVWCPKDNTPVGDHDRVEGEGETPKDFVWAKFRMKHSDLIIMAGTTRPDALLGQTHIWIDPQGEYVVAKVKGEKWVVGKEAIRKIEQQFAKPEIIGSITAGELIGKWAQGPLVGYETTIIPAAFIDATVGSGIVYSALEDPVDLMEMQHIQAQPEIARSYGLDPEVIAKLKPIFIIDVEGLGENLGQEMLDKYRITSPADKKKLEDAKGELNRVVFRKGVMNKSCGRYAGMSVPQAQEAIKKDLIKGNDAVMFYELTGKAVCRCLTECIVKVVSDQWFLHYSDEEWKKAAHECLNSMRLYPEKSRQQFNYVIDWLQNWACVREYGLGTKLPWDRKWVIEALSDSTIYMAYYTLAHLIRDENPEDIDDSLFDYVFALNKDPPKNGKKIRSLEAMKKEFGYWYPMDFRNSGKDLIQNHLTMCIFNHTAIFPRKHWPQSFGVNGWVTVDGKKMSKSSGNFILLKDLVQQAPVDASRITILSGGEGLDDPNWDSEFAKACPAKLEGLTELCLGHHGKGRADMLSADHWMESTLHLIIRDATTFMDELMFRSALQKIFFDLPKAMRQYLRKTSSSPNRAIMDAAITAQIVMLSPFAPFLAEELWQKTGGKGLVAHARWPAYDEKKIDEKATYIDDMLSSARGDIDAVLHLAKISKPSTVTLLIAHPWTYDLVKLVKEQLPETRNPGDILKAAMATPLKQHGAHIAKLVPKLVNNPSMLPAAVLSQEQEQHAFAEAKSLYEDELKCPVEIVRAQDSTHPKAQQALPGKPAIIVT